MAALRTTIPAARPGVSVLLWRRAPTLQLCTAVATRLSAAQPSSRALMTTSTSTSPSAAADANKSRDDNDTSAGAGTGDALPVAKKPRGSKPSVVVLGTGWASFALSRIIDKNLWDVHIVSPRNHMVFTPLLASTAVGTLEFRGIAEPVRSSIGGNDVHLHLGKARGIDPVAKTVRVVMRGDGDDSPAVVKGQIGVSTFDLPYDALVVGVGARNLTFGIPGVSEHVHFMKELSDARGVRKAILERLEAAANPVLPEAERRRLAHFVVVGGGPTGVEFSAELHDFIEQDVSRHYPEVYPLAKITLIEGRTILGSFSDDLRAYTLKRFKNFHIDIRTGANVKNVSPTTITLSDGTELPYGLCVWSTGVGPRKVTGLLDPAVFAKDQGGRLRTDEFMRVLRESPGEGDSAVLDGIFAMGDCANVGDAGYPAIAQVAERQGKWLAKALNETRRAGIEVSRIDELSKGFTYQHLGSLAYVGKYAGLADFTHTGTNVPPPVRGSAITGLASWLIWRSSYLSQLGAWRNKLQVPMDWLRTFIFGRDINSF